MNFLKQGIGGTLHLKGMYLTMKASLVLSSPSACSHQFPVLYSGKRSSWLMIASYGLLWPGLDRPLSWPVMLSASLGLDFILLCDFLKLVSTAPQALTI